jgi:hypothetical protein
MYVRYNTCTVSKVGQSAREKEKTGEAQKFETTKDTTGADTAQIVPDHIISTRGGHTA